MYLESNLGLGGNTGSHIRRLLQLSRKRCWDSGIDSSGNNRQREEVYTLGIFWRFVLEFDELNGGKRAFKDKLISLNLLFTFVTSKVFIKREKGVEGDSRSC